MERERNFLRRLAEDAQLYGEALPGQSIVEILSDSRVLVENHLGVKGYTREQILIKVKCGCIQVCGRGLELRKMTRDQLVIFGRIGAVTLHREAKT